MMIPFFTENLGTIAVTLLLAGCVAAIVRKLVRDKRNGNAPGCSSCCADCPSKAARCGSK